MKFKTSILIVDDDIVSRRKLALFIKSKGFELYEAQNGEEALAVIGDVYPSLILSDIEMPVMDGLNLLKELIDRKIEIPIVIMTGYGSIEYAVEAMKNGAADFLTKPLDLSYVLKVVNRVLERSKMEQKIKEQQRQLDSDLRYAALFQKHLLPDCFETSCLSFQYRYQPMIDIGGDYLNVHKYSDNKMTVALYDVSGHGVTAAFVAHLAHSHLQMLLAGGLSPSEIIDRVNRYIEKVISGTNMFITMIVLTIDGENGKMTICNAGHPDVLLCRKEQADIISIPSDVPVVGFVEDVLVKQQNETQIDVQPGDKIILYTDGFLEARNQDKKMLEYEGFKELIESCREVPPKDFIGQIFERLEDYQEDDQDDDLTLISIDVK